jgi:adenine C2-methylase RlmN of 23S rRNA A2503 and tRNA A37
MKFLSQLSSSDTLEQIFISQQVLNHVHSGSNHNEDNAAFKQKEQDLLRNIVFMGMGEPLDN